MEPCEVVNGLLGSFGVIGEGCKVAKKKACEVKAKRGKHKVEDVTPEVKVDDSSAEAACAAKQDKPTNADELHAWLRKWLDVTLPREAVVEGHSATFDYIEWAFFEDQRFDTESMREASRERERASSPLRGSERTEGSSSPAPTPTHAILNMPPDGVVWANRGGGKTFLGAVATLLDMVFKPGIEVRILAGSMEQALRMHEHLRRLLEREELSGLIAGKITDKKIELTNGSRVELLAQSQASVRGARVQRLRCDEVELFDPAVWEAAQLTTRTKRCGGELVRGSIECFSTMHVPHGLMHRMVAEAREGKRRLFKWGVVDVLDQCAERRKCEGDAAAAAPNPPRPCGLLDNCRGRAKMRKGNAESVGIGHITIDDALRMKGRVSLATWEAEMMSLRPRRDDAVLPEFEAGVHVIAASPFESGSVGGDGAAILPGAWPVTWIGGMDFGYRSPAVVLWAAYDEATRRLYVMDERVRSGQTVAEHAQAIVRSPWPPLEWIGIDPAGNAMNEQTGTSAANVLRKARLTVRSSRVPTVRGLELIRARLQPADSATCGGPRLFVHVRCVKLIESLERYHYPEGDPESVVPEKDGADHAVDALRYMIQNLDQLVRARCGRWA